MLTTLLLMSAFSQVEVRDLATIPPQSGALTRVLGVRGDGSFGVPVAGGYDMDGDGFNDFAIAYMTAPNAPTTAMDYRAGEVNLVFGTGEIGEEIVTAQPQERVLRILGVQKQENAGSEIWMRDITGDNLGDLIICRQNYSPPGRTGSGAVTIIPGSPALRTFAAGTTPYVLDSPPPGINQFTILGAAAGDRLCIWARAGDVTGDGTNDLVVAADQESDTDAFHGGALYLFEGGSHFAGQEVYDLAAPVSGSLATRTLRIVTDRPAGEFHFGGTVQVGDLDANGRDEIIAATTLNRAGASLRPDGSGVVTHGSGGEGSGVVYIIWDDSIPALPFTPGQTLATNTAPGGITRITGAPSSQNFGEELLGGLDYDGSGDPDLFIGDLTALGFKGEGWILFDVASLKTNPGFAIPSYPGTLSRIIGPVSSAISGDTAAHGDFDADGFDDLANCSPKDRPLGRTNAGTIHVLMGRPQPWPASVDLGQPQTISGVRVVNYLGREGLSGQGQGDILCYSAADGDVDDDGAVDLIVNEMTGDGEDAMGNPRNDVGNLLIISGDTAFSFKDGFESN